MYPLRGESTTLGAGELVSVPDLERAERLAGTEIGAGDCVVVRVGLEEREAVEGPEDVSLRAGLHHDCLPWFHEREIAVYSGDCVERVPYPSAELPMPLHQIGLVKMGLVLLDNLRLQELVATCARFSRHEFLITVAPLRTNGGTGSAVNPIAVF
jgi:kynurenine formamidase